MTTSPEQGHGFVDVFDLQGNFVGRLSSRPAHSPWGLAIAPIVVRQFGGDLLVGNFGDGRINAFDAATGALFGQVSGLGGAPLRSTGCGRSPPATTAARAAARLIYFSAGPDDESHGLFGVLTPVPEPSVSALLGDRTRRRRAGDARTWPAQRPRRASGHCGRTTGRCRLSAAPRKQRRSGTRAVRVTRRGAIRWAAAAVAMVCSLAIGQAPIATQRLRGTVESFDGGRAGR